jgi:phytoene/squalene synthetase
MRMDLHVTSYNSYTDIRIYVLGSARVIGRLIRRTLEPTASAAIGHWPSAIGHAERLGKAVLVANFTRHVCENLARGCIYLPPNKPARHSVSAQTLATRQVTDELRGALGFQNEHSRTLRLCRARDPPAAPDVTGMRSDCPASVH